MQYFSPIICALCLSLFPNVANSQIVINELMAANAATIDDPDFGKKADWIELYNTSEEQLQLDSFYLSDNLDNPFKWQIPSEIIIEGKGYLIFWADGENIGNHCNFKLSKSGESLGLFNVKGVLLDSIVFPAQNNDISYGRSSDGQATFTFFPQPTPNATNNTLAFGGIVPFQPKFSVIGGVYDTPLEIQLSALEGTIRYTLDGRIPTDSDPIYINPIAINSTQTLRARVFINGQIAGKTITHSYFFNENFVQRGLPTVAISTDPAFFWDANIGLYTQDFKPDWEYPINIEFFENDGNNRAVFNEPAGVRINGNNSWQFPQKILGIYFRNDYGKKELDYPIFFDRDRNNFDYFALRVSGNDQGSTFFKDALCQKIIADNMDFDLQGYRPAAVYVNGEYLGLHNIRSKQNKEYFEHYYNLKEDEFDLIANNGEVDAGDADAFQDLIQLINQDLSIPANYTALEKVLDIENTIDHFITKIWLSDGSWGHNIKLWKPKSSDAKWRWVIKDVDRGFSGIDNNDIDYFTDVDSSPSSYSYARQIVRQLFQNPTFSNRFTTRFADHLYTTFHPNSIAPIISEMQAHIAKEIPYHLTVWGGVTADYGDALPSEKYWQDEVVDLHTFINERRAFLYRDITQYFLIDTIATLGIISIPADAGKFEFNDFNLPAANWSGTYFQNTPVTAKADAQIGYEFQGWATANYETIIPRASEWKYWDQSTLSNANWQSTNFDDNEWKTGLAEFGYGDDDENTIIAYGPDADNKLIANYFRKTFEIEDVTAYADQLVFNILKDDGAILYLNGEEISRLNLPSGSISETTTAYNTVEKVQERDFHQLVVDSKFLKNGSNVLAVAVYQRSSSSSDLSFDLDLKAIKLSDTPIVSEEKAITLQLTSDTVLVAKYQPVNACILPNIISRSTTLTTACSPYQVLDELTILPNVSLTLEAGVEILMPEDANLTVVGDLQVEGTAENPVVIRPNHLIGATNWGQLHFTNSTNRSSLNHLIIDGATKGQHPIRDNAAISAFYADLHLNHIVFQNVDSKLMYAQYSNVKVDSSLLKTNAKGNMIAFHDGVGSINYCDIKGNQKSNTAAIRLENMRRATIHQNKLYDFLGKNNHGIEVVVTENVFITDNFLHNFTDKGILVEDESFATISNNTFVNCQEGVAVQSQGIAIINENTFYNNEIGIRVFEKELGTGGGIAQISNNILSNSSKLAIDFDATSFINITNCLSDTEELIGTDNILANPLFVNPTKNDFRLTSNSPAINQGLQNGQQINLGTKSFVFSVPPSLLINQIDYQPATEEEAEFISIFNPSDSIIDLSGYTFSDAFKFEIPTGVQMAPQEEILIVKDLSFFNKPNQQVLQWTSGKLKDSGETIKLTDANGILVDHVTFSNAQPWPIDAAGNGAHLSLTNTDLDNHFPENWSANNLSVGLTNLDNLSTNFSFYPNPVHQQLFVNLGNAVNQSGSIQLSNSLGQIIATYNFKHFPNTPFPIDLSNIEKGIYLITLKMDDGQVTTKKLTTE